MDTENSKTNEQHKFVRNLSQRLDLKSSYLKNEIKKLLYFWYHQNKITKKKFKTMQTSHYNNESIH